ncbi:hypothetical protein LCGC14_1015960 [marine sediment metagenome]|uniref:Uncharacterized protein n=1 Tax=marine sediment metagenome TaxID=412755 RepID=A0A0F9NKE4_9ZZZZ
MKRKEHTLFYFNEEFDRVLRKCDEERAAKLVTAYLKATQGKLIKS